MEILDDDNDLRTKLKGLAGRDIHIVSAFAVSTDGLVATLRQRNRVELVVGTMNYFTSPDFLKAVRDQPAGRKGFWVDFRIGASIHWKLYLVSPNTVIVGSANLTDKGVAMRGETSVLIRSKALYEDYRARVKALQSDPDVVPATGKSFDRRLAEYMKQHLRNQAARQASGADRPDGAARVPTLSQWLKDEANQSIAVYLWDSHVEPKYKKAARRVVDKQRVAQGKARSAPGRNPYSELFTSGLGRGGRLPYRSGDVALCASVRGGFVGFHKFHVVAKAGDTGMMIELRREPHAFPFDVTPALKARIKRYIASSGMDSGPKVFPRSLLESFLDE